MTVSGFDPHRISADNFTNQPIPKYLTDEVDISK